MKSICVFCGSSAGSDEAYAHATQLFGAAIARRGLTLVYGGGNVGLMGIVADSALAHGGKVIGVIPQALVKRELAHRGLTELHVVNSMHERKALMADLADGFVALPGGFGTLDEFCEIVTWAQLGLHAKPCGVLNVKSFFDPFLAQIDRAVAEQFVQPEHRALLLVEESPESLLERMPQFQPPKVQKWIGRDSR